jgi:DNA-binding LytR/AlgR family response regulator
VSGVLNRLLRVLIVDDEPLACRLMRELLREHDDVAVVGEARSAAEAAAMCASTPPDVLLLDIDMPGASGFDLLPSLEPVPAIIFTTAHAEFALDAFEVNAVDYLLKPVTEARLGRALNRLRRTVARPDLRIPPPVPQSSRLVFRLPSQIVFVAADEIEWIGAEGNYCRIHTGNRTILIRELMVEIERRLDPSRFVRVHRSAIVNVDSIQKIAVDEHGRYALVLRTGEEVRVGAKYRAELRRAIGELL